MTSSTQDASSAAASEHYAPAHRLDLLGILSLFTAEWRTGLITALILFALATIAILRIPSQFEATAVILPRDQASTGTSSSLLSFFTGAPKATNNYATLLTSRTLRDDIIRRLDLMSYFHYTSRAAAHVRLYGMTRISSGDTVSILVRDKDAKVAAKIANAYVDALRSLQESLATTQGEIERRYFEQQLNRERAALAAAEQDLARTQVSSGLVQAEAQTQIGLGAIAGIRSQINDLQVRLAALLQGSTEDNFEVKNLRSQIAQLQIQEQRLEKGGSSGVGAAPAASRMPRANLEYSRKLREVHFHEALVSSLANRYEALRMAATGSTDTFDVIDPALPPEFPTWPPRPLYLALAAGGALFAGVLAIAIQLLVRRILSDPLQRSYLHSIRRNFSWSR